MSFCLMKQERNKNKEKVGKQTYTRSPPTLLRKASSVRPARTFELSRIDF